MRCLRWCQCGVMWLVVVQGVDGGGGRGSEACYCQERRQELECRYVTFDSCEYSFVKLPKYFIMYMYVTLITTSPPPPHLLLLSLLLFILLISPLSFPSLLLSPCITSKSYFLFVYSGHYCGWEPHTPAVSPPLEKLPPSWHQEGEMEPWRRWGVLCKISLSLIYS